MKVIWNELSLKKANRQVINQTAQRKMKNHFVKRDKECQRKEAYGRSEDLRTNKPTEKSIEKTSK